MKQDSASLCDQTSKEEFALICIPRKALAGTRVETANVEDIIMEDCGVFGERRGAGWSKQTDLVQEKVIGLLVYRVSMVTSTASKRSRRSPERGAKGSGGATPLARSSCL